MGIADRGGGNPRDAYMYIWAEWMQERRGDSVAIVGLHREGIVDCVLTLPLVPWALSEPASMGPLSEELSPLRGIVVVIADVDEIRVVLGFGVEF
jgi:hypothetical protein